LRLESIILSRSTRSRLESRSHMKESLFFVFFKIRNPKSEIFPLSSIFCPLTSILSLNISLCALRHALCASPVHLRCNHVQTGDECYQIGHHET
jgi:hypothetical protein